MIFATIGILIVVGAGLFATWVIVDQPLAGAEAMILAAWIVFLGAAFARAGGSFCVDKANRMKRIALDVLQAMGLVTCGLLVLMCTVRQFRIPPAPRLEWAPTDAVAIYRDNVWARYEWQIRGSPRFSVVYSRFDDSSCPLFPSERDGVLILSKGCL